jgi:hypothetical protein
MTKHSSQYLYMFLPWFSTFDNFVVSQRSFGSTCLFKGKTKSLFQRYGNFSLPSSELFPTCSKGNLFQGGLQNEPDSSERGEIFRMRRNLQNEVESSEFKDGTWEKYCSSRLIAQAWSYGMDLLYVLVCQSNQPEHYEPAQCYWDNNVLIYHVRSCFSMIQIHLMWQNLQNETEPLE